MIIDALEAKNNVRKYKKDFGTSSLELILKEIKYLSENGNSEIKIGRLNCIAYLNKKDYYLLKRAGFDIKFFATYEEEKINPHCTRTKTRDISLKEYFNNNYENNLKDKTVIVSWK